MLLRDRWKVALKLQSLGLTNEEIGDRLGVSPQRAALMVKAGRRLDQHASVSVVTETVALEDDVSD